MSLMKREVHDAFSKLRGMPEKEQYLKSNNTTYTYDSRQTLIIWCQDGILELKPVHGTWK